MRTKLVIESPKGMMARSANAQVGNEETEQCQ